MEDLYDTKCAKCHNKKMVAIWNGSQVDKWILFQCRMCGYEDNRLPIKNDMLSIIKNNP